MRLSLFLLNEHDDDDDDEHISIHRCMPSRLKSKDCKIEDNPHLVYRFLMTRVTFNDNFKVKRSRGQGLSAVAKLNHKHVPYCKTVD